MTDSEFLNWLGDRLVYVYGESENVDFVLKVRRLAQAAAQPANAEARMLHDLLARIHRDGGHYVAQHGLDKAVEDADLIVSDLLALQQASAEAGKGVEREEAAEPWEDGNGVIRNGVLPDAQEASEPENTRFPMNVYLRNEDELWDFMMENLQELVAKRGIQLSRGR